MPLFNFPKGRSATLSAEQVADVILHCKTPSQDARFAKKYGVSSSCIRAIRLGDSWVWLRQRMKTGWRP